MPLKLSIDVLHVLLRTFRRVAVWSMLVGLAIGLPLQVLSSTLAGMLGPRHEHQAVSSLPSHDRSDDSMAGWRDFRRDNYEHRAAATSGTSMHRQAHEAGLRHRHAPETAGVVDLETPADGDGAPANSSPAGAAFAVAVEVGHLEPSPRPAIDGDEIWRMAIAGSLATSFPRRIERPPSGA
jgi:hypothetical protein